MTKKELVERLSEYDDDTMVIVTDSMGWSNIVAVEPDGVVVAIATEETPIFNED